MRYRNFQGKKNIQKILIRLLTKNLNFYKVSNVLTNNARLAQLVEQWTVNPCVAGSKPAAGAKKRILSFERILFHFKLKVNKERF